MHNYVKSRKLLVLFFVVNVIIIFSLAFILRKHQFTDSDYRIVGLIILLIVYLIVSYLVGVFNFDGGQLSYQAISIILANNIIFMLLFSTIFFTRKTAITIFTISCLYQIILKFFVVNSFSITENILVITDSQNEETQTSDYCGVKQLVQYDVKAVMNTKSSEKLYEFFLKNPNEFVKEKQISMIIIENIDIGLELQQALFNLKMHGIKIVNALVMYEYLNEKIQVRNINLKWFLFSGFESLNSLIYMKFKRVCDVILAAIILIITSPIIALIAILIKLESEGSVFFKQERIGHNNHPFIIIKMRSMQIDAEKEGAKWATKKDIRITKVGKFIRKTRIDELPQCINIIRGEMSFVGPRPEREVFINDLKKSIPFYDVRHNVKPGVTGLAQIKYRYGASVEDSEEKLKYDLYYIKHASLWLDIMILVRTVKTVLLFKGN
ncbi:MAG: exopolysaccharide biosynthesis polyprenyl glycosylphosphotransferase [Fusobacteria bacterium]|nr:exopolysaccharide biosynthesis polyprenyl glycosylphosphotransferase [Fusobacteriota bacterium]